jgi:hypothetical protein
MPADLRLSQIQADDETPSPGGSVNTTFGVFNYGDEANGGHEICLVTFVGPDESELYREDIAVHPIEPGHNQTVHRTFTMGHLSGDYEITLHCGAEATRLHLSVAE